ncbi:hypothetical protein HNP38_002889 [Chryseobacterium defluvii]|uniref:Amidohydrolase-related domain-containing protein n=1 Tax=Chryseobacterium defluvii TaxID=160396 RepID=A0A840KJA0_9FLAO|nr:amidohydrolase family protein [Chryseobacterium defluvii]MBB4807583.1 hypothetical protein [Chryseobacterium defluvii]
MKSILTGLIGILAVFSCSTREVYDLKITNANVLNVRSGTVEKNRTVLIQNGIIKEISGKKDYRSKETINASGKLVTPGFIDTHIHPTDIFGDYEKAPEYLQEDKLPMMRKALSDQYVPYGTTTVMTMGQPEKWIKPLLKWQNQPDHGSVEFYLCGGALISKDNRTPYIAHTEVTSPEMAGKKIVEYHNLGIKNIKLYYRLKEPEFSAVTKAADSLNMKMFGHIGDFNPEYLNINQTLKLGLTNYEHLATIPNSIITSDEDWALLDKQFKDHFGDLNSEAKVIEFFLEQFRFISEHKTAEMQAFIKEMKDKNVTFSTTLHRIYEQIEPTFFTDRKDTALTQKQLDRSKENFAIMMKYVKEINDKGILLRLGSDMPNGGKVNLSELIILAKHGFRISDIFKIASYNGAKTIGIEKETGSVEKGKKADMIIWHQDPFENYSNFTSKITVIKGGRKYVE